MHKGFTIVLKIGTSSLVDEVTREPLLSNMSLIVETAVKLRRAGHRIVLVSSGAIAVGLKRMGMAVKPKRLAQVQALAAIGQGRLIGLYDDLFRQFAQPIAQILITRNDIVDYTQFRNAQSTIESLLDMGVIPIVNENDTLSVAEIKFGDNDTLSAITAVMANADYLFLMTDVDCLYTDNPRTNPDAKPILCVGSMDELEVDTSSGGSDVGTGGMTTKLIAAELCMDSGVTAIIMKLSQPANVLPIVEYIQSISNAKATGELASQLAQLSLNKVPLHTRFIAEPRPINNKKFWLLHGLKTKGSLIIDQGAYKAIIPPNRAGLLPAGIIGVEGSFHESEPVKLMLGHRDPETGLWDKTKETLEFGRARVNYKAMEIQMIMGKHSWEIEGILGYHDSEYVAHRDNLAFPPSEVRAEAKAGV
ncbi:hypothetical protein BABINDRAFT_172797 [Babjeviella inositovora NRRL Y-12698]|uniref:PUA domain-containing protein n=1 Tax=Babjeviella inositovora NRRL Y-12698 TaxID=984486 RepID=A0A1E3QIC0_9ASCO|nr:uncharacterized protein BABINDRAFT_172797 [Babjeviella inositovora NRRL Y-12698]ODQ77446.1 hypothetical protein BABINDRAFT_172797 [Babjeviella inositovora NRRL Y-12698]